MIRSKTLLFPTFQLFRQWYLSMKTRFNALTLKLVRFNTLKQGVWCTIVY